MPRHVLKTNKKILILNPKLSVPCLVVKVSIAPCLKKNEEEGVGSLEMLSSQHFAWLCFVLFFLDRTRVAR